VGEDSPQRTDHNYATCLSFRDKLDKFPVLCHEEENPLLTTDVELKPAGVEKDIPTDAKKTMKNEVGGK
jgi:hypothetical protein